MEGKDNLGAWAVAKFRWQTTKAYDVYGANIQHWRSCTSE